MKYVFLILHYNTIDETTKSVKSIIDNCGQENYSIVIVDNASTNDSYLEMQSMYSNNDKITLIHNEQNLGFANGNNVGIDFIKKELDADFIIMMNNDVYLTDNHFLDSIEKIFEQYQFAVLGPMIHTPDGKSDTNPYGKFRYTLDGINTTIAYCEKQIKLINMRLKGIYDFLVNIKSKIANHKKNDEKDYKDTVINAPLHGSCLIFSKIFLDRLGGLDSRTFMYGEESILYIKCLGEKIISMYSPQIQVFHNEHATANKEKRGRQQQLFFFENLLKSTKVLREVYLEYFEE